MPDLEQKVAQTLLAEHQGSYEHAFHDLCARYVRLHNDVCPGFGRWAMNDRGADPKIDVPPNPITDEWISTGVDA